MFSNQVIVVRVFSVVFLAGLVSTGVGYLSINPFSRSNKDSDSEPCVEKGKEDDEEKQFDFKDNSLEVENDFPPDFRVIIHGGAGVVSKGIDSKPFFDSLSRIMGAAYKYGKKGSDTVTAVDLAEYCVKLLEDDILFNAGRGAVFTNFETIEMEASIMDGWTLECGAVSLIKTVKHPISLARAVMEHTNHNHLIGKAAEQLAVRCNLDIVDPTYFHTAKRKEQLRRAKESDTIVNDHDYEEEQKNIEKSKSDEHIQFLEIEKSVQLMKLHGIGNGENSEDDNDIFKENNEGIQDDKSEFGKYLNREREREKINGVNDWRISKERKEVREKEKVLEEYYPGSTGTVG
jgi:hypothetical protein